MDREDGMVRERPAVLLLKHLHDCWPAGRHFASTSGLIDALVDKHPAEWGDPSPFGKRLTVLATSYGLNSSRLDRTGPRGYTRAALLPVWHRMGVVRDERRSTAPSPTATGASGADGASGAGLSACLTCHELVELAVAGATGRHPTCL